MLEVIKNTNTDDKSLARAIESLGPTTESPAFWIEIANSSEYNTTHRRRAVVALFIRHVRPGMTLAQLGAILSGSQWFEDEDVRLVEDVSGYLPVQLTHDNSVFVIRVLPKLPPPEYWAIYLGIEDKVERVSFVSVLRGQGADERTNNAVIQEIAVHPSQ